MRILLLGEYSRLHLSLAEGLRHLGHDVVLASDGDSFKNYERDIDLTRRSSSLIDTASCLISTLRKFSKFKNYDVVQLINPCFTTLNVRVNDYLYSQLRKNNKKVFLGAFGDDSFWVRTCIDKDIFKYSEFYVDGKSTNLAYNQLLKRTWIDSQREQLNIKIANSCNGIVACLYEYYISYIQQHKDKTQYIPLPINTDSIQFEPINESSTKTSFFIGVNNDRSEYKGTDIMEDALLEIEKKYPDRVNIIKAESVGYKEYKEMMSASHVVLDQLYSHSPSMNALLAMAQGKILVGGGEPEIYDLLNEDSNRPIVNVYPSKESVFSQLEYLVLHQEQLTQRAVSSRLFVDTHHNYIAVAQQYLDFWNKK